MKFIINVGKVILSVIYAILKLIPIKKNKILFLSRQSNELSLDFSMLKSQLEKDYPKVKVVCICNRMSGKKDGVLRFAISSLRSMYHLATSSVCVLDAYWPVVSVLKHKQGLTVIQMWHALGKIKQSGYQTLGKESGRGLETARLLKMHENYDIIIAGGRAWNPFYCKSFNVTEDKLLNIGLPRIDYLIDNVEKNREKVYEVYPQFKEKKVVLYAPTFRKGIELDWQSLVENVNYSDCILIIKGHPNQEIHCEREGVFLCPEFKAVDLLAVCDYLVTDYSAIAVEGAILNRPTLYYVYDFQEYMSKNGLNLNVCEAMPGCAFKNSKDIVNIIDNDSYNYSALETYRKNYLPEELGTSTKKLTGVILENLYKK